VDSNRRPLLAILGQPREARCGEPVSVKVRDYCFTNAERFGGLIYCFNDQRGF
jgi:hypothetical protein